MYFITGGSGLIGSFTIKRLVAEGFPVRALRRAGSSLELTAEVNSFVEWVEGDLEDIVALENNLEGVHTIIHSAAIVSYSPAMKEKIFRINFEGTRNLVNAAINTGVEKFCHISSVAALGKKKNDPVITEEHSFEMDQLNSTYAQSKFLAELEVYRGFEEGLKGFMVNPSIVLGPGFWDKGSTGIFKYVYDQNWFYTKGSANYVDVRDLTDILVRLLTLKAEEINREKFIISGGAVSYKELFERIAHCFNKRPPRYNANRFLSGLAWRFEKLRSIIAGSEPFITEESSKLGRSAFTYNNSKVKNLLNHEFRKLDDTISWTCRELLKNI